MPNYEDLKKMAKDALDTIADVSVEAYKIAEEKARILAKRAILTTDITRERALIRRAKISIGDVYYNLHKDDPGEAFKQYCDNINDSLELIEAKQRELEELKKGNVPCDEESCGCTECEVPAEEAKEEEKEEPKE